MRSPVCTPPWRQPLGPRHEGIGKASEANQQALNARRQYIVTTSHPGANASCGRPTAQKAESLQSESARSSLARLRRVELTAFAFQRNPASCRRYPRDRATLRKSAIVHEDGHIVLHCSSGCLKCLRRYVSRQFIRPCQLGFREKLTTPF